jgi:hypothetical protein
MLRALLHPQGSTAPHNGIFQVMDGAIPARLLEMNR